MTPYKKYDGKFTSLSAITFNNEGKGLDDPTAGCGAGDGDGEGSYTLCGCGDGYGDGGGSINLKGSGAGYGDGANGDEAGLDIDY